MATQPNHQIATVVGRNIRTARERAGLTQIQLATKLGTSISRISGWETGKHLPQNPQAIADELTDGDVVSLYRELEKEAA